jgi:hypothetical protein
VDIFRVEVVFFRELAFLTDLSAGLNEHITKLSDEGKSIVTAIDTIDSLNKM